MPQLPPVKRKGCGAVATRTPLRPLRVQSPLSKRSCETTAVSRKAALNSSRELIHEDSHSHDPQVRRLPYRLRRRLSLPTLPLRARPHRDARFHPHLCCGRPSADVRSLRPHPPCRSHEEASPHRSAVDHPRRYPRRHSRAYDEVRLQDPVSVLEQSMSDEFLKLLAESQHTLDQGFAHLPPNPETPLGEAASNILHQVAIRLH